MAIPRVLCRFRLRITNDFSVVRKYTTFVNSVLINKNVLVQKQFRTNFSTSFMLNKSSSSSSSSDSDQTDSDSDEEDVTVEYHRGLPQITVPLPSRKEKCKFTLKPISNTVGDFLDMLKKEDKGIDRVVCQSCDGTRIASSNTIETLLDGDFKLIINDHSYNVNTPKQERLRGEEVQRLNDVRNLVNQLYEALHVQEHQVIKEKELATQLETLQQELLPLEEKRNELELVAHRRGDWLSWTGLGLMSVQFGILARLTWWEYSWDIMEPVTYFVTYGTAMAAYAYFVLTKEEYILADVKDRQHLLILHKRAKKLGLDLNQYNTLREQINQIEFDLRKLRNPLRLQLPPKLNTTAQTTATNATLTALLDKAPIVMPQAKSAPIATSQTKSAPVKETTSKDSKTK